MNGAYYIMLINVALAVMLLLGFAGFWLYDRNRKAPLFFFLATLCFLFSASMELVAKFVTADVESIYRFILYSINLAAGTLLTCGVMLHYKQPLYWSRMLLFVAAGLLLTFAVLDMPRQSVLRLALNQIPIVSVIAIGAIRLIRIDKKLIIDRLLVIALVIFAINLAARPAILAIYGTMGHTVADFQNTQYAIVVQFSLTLVTMATATILMLVLVADLVQDLMREGLSDSLTGLTNRKCFDKLANEALERAAQHQTPITLMMCDIDHFKSINDTHGHNCGDQAISFVGKMLGNVTSSFDVAARVGGEEFCIVFWNTTIEQGYQLSEDIRAAINATSLPFPTGEQQISASFGVAEYRNGEALKDLYKRADLAMYAAKSSGRNLVSRCDEDTTIIRPNAFNLKAA